MIIEEKEERSDKSSDAHADDNFPADHPGKQQISKNPNPGANENVPDETDNSGDKPEDATQKAGSEITDGGAG